MGSIGEINPMRTYLPDLPLRVHRGNTAHLENQKKMFHKYYLMGHCSQTL